MNELAKNLSEGIIFQCPSITLNKTFINSTSEYRLDKKEREILLEVEDPYVRNSFGICFYENFFIYCRLGILTEDGFGNIKISRVNDALGYHVVVFNPANLKDGRIIEGPSQWDIDIFKGA